MHIVPVKSCWLSTVIHVLDCVLSNTLSFIYQIVASQRIYFSLSRDNVESDQPAVAWILFFTFLEDRLEIHKQSSGISSDCHDLSKLIESGLAVIIFMHTLRYIPSSPTHLCEIS